MSKKEEIARLMEEAHKREHQPFEEWHKDILVQLLNFFERNHPTQLGDLLKEYYEWMGGN